MATSAMEAHLDVLAGGAVEVPERPHRVGEVLRVALPRRELAHRSQECVGERHIQPRERPQHVGELLRGHLRRLGVHGHREARYEPPAAALEQRERVQRVTNRLYACMHERSLRTVRSTRCCERWEPGRELRYRPA